MGYLIPLALALPSSAEGAELMLIENALTSGEEAPSLSRTELLREAGFHIGLHASAPPDGARAAVLECRGDPRCVAARLAEASVDLVLLVGVNHRLKPALLSVQLIDVRASKTLSSEAWPESEAGDGVAAELVAELRRALDRAGHPLGARLVLDLLPREAAAEAGEVHLPPGLGPIEAVVPVGRRHLRIWAEGHQSAERELDLEAGKELSLSIQLEKESSVWSSPWLWIGVGAVAGGAVGTALFLRGHGDPSYTICQGKCTM
jgi:hypothetical protein